MEIEVIVEASAVVVEAPPSAPAVVGVDINHGLPGTPGTNGTNGADGTNGTDGIDGTDGRGIVSIIRTTGNGAPGTTDTFTITYTDATTSTFQVYNGADGEGTGDMLASDYAASSGVVKDSAKLGGQLPAYYAKASDIPDALSDLSDDATHRLVTDTEKATWNGKQASITASGILKGDGSGGVSGATAGTDYEAPPTINVNTAAAPALGTIAHNNEYRCTNASISTAPTLTLAAIAATSTRFYAAVIYKSPGTTAPVVTNNSGYTAKWQGLDVSSGTFSPKSGVVYRLSIAFDGIYLNIYVSGV